MNEPHVDEEAPMSGSPEEIRSALFAHMVMQQSSMAMMLLGKTPHPETGKVLRDLEAAKLFIDQLEMLEFKTKGNLTQEESALLKQSLMSLRMAFVEAVESPSSGAEARPGYDSTAVAPSPPPEPAAKTAPASAPGQEESPKKFTKKY